MAHAELITLTVHAPDAEYPVYIGAGERHALAAWLTERGIAQAVIVTNESIAPLYGRALAESLGAPLLTLPDGEQHKTLENVRILYDQFAAAGLDRHAAVIALGGGVIGDMVGFAAATYLRGVRFIQMPTSLLAMVDASVGGKVGVDLPAGKNLVGAFKQPEMVILDTETLATLPDAEWRSGLAEVIKSGLIDDLSLLDVSTLDRGAPADFIARAVRVKIRVVERDPYEQNIRAYLNLGHTFAHALETVSGYRWRHGEAVAVGLVGAARLSALTGQCEPELPARVESLVRAVGLPTSYAEYDPADLRAAMNADKKRQNGRVRFVLLHAPGAPLLTDDVSEAQIMIVLESLRTSA